MKKILLISALATGLFFSCKKENIEPSIPVIRYDVQADYAVVYSNNNLWRVAKENPTRVAGKWSYEYNADRIDTAILIVYVGVMFPTQKVKMSISKNGKIVKSFEKIYSAPDDWGKSDTLKYVIR